MGRAHLHSNAGKQVVEQLIGESEEYARQLWAQTKIPERLQLPVIPLGVDCNSLTATHSAKAAGRDLRRRLGIGDDEIVILYAGRLDHRTKANPIPMYLATEAAARRTAKRLRFLNVGWFRDDATERAFVEAANKFCPSATAIFIKKTSGPVYQAAWHAADISLSLVDNIPRKLWPYAAGSDGVGLAVVVSDWDATVIRFGTVSTGFAFRLRCPPPAPVAICTGVLSALMTYDHYVASVSQYVAVDVPALDALVALIESAELRQSMGAAAQQRALRAVRLAICSFANIKIYGQNCMHGVATLRTTAQQLRSLGRRHPGRPVRRALLRQWRAARSRSVSRFCRLRDGVDQ